MSMFEDLRAEVHRAVDRAFDAWPAQGSSGHGNSEPSAQAEEPLDESFTQKWPDSSEERFSKGRYFSVAIGGEVVRVLVAWADAPKFTWGRDRCRAVSFLLLRGDASGERYPLSEWVEADDGAMATGVPNPARPRALLKDGEPRASWLSGWTCVRADELFESVANGPSLRVVVNKEAENRMAEFAVRVGLLRGRISVGDRPWREWRDNVSLATSSPAPTVQSGGTGRRPWSDWPATEAPSAERRLQHANRASSSK
jgi:hypothetical protein